jgi:hypothetical protein
MNKPETVIAKYKAIQDIGHSVSVPYEVWSLFGSTAKAVEVLGTQISLGEDYAPLENVRSALEWYVGQLGGKVKWDKHG